MANVTQKPENTDPQGTDVLYLVDDPAGTPEDNYLPIATLLQKLAVALQTTGGDARGSNAVDLQVARTADTQVASGATSFVVGANNTASGISSIALGTQAVASRNGQLSQAYGRFAADGDGQSSVIIMRCKTTGGSGYFSVGGDGATFLTIPTDTTWLFSFLVVARRSDADNESAAYRLEGCIDNNAGTTALVGSVSTTNIAEDNVGWNVIATADNSQDQLLLQAIGEIGKTIYWVARATLVEVTG